MFEKRFTARDPAYLSPPVRPGPPKPDAVDPTREGHFAVSVDSGSKRWLVVDAATCPACNKVVIAMFSSQPDHSVSRRFVFPEGITRAPIPATVPEHIAEDYREAVLVLPYSPKASAALSRRCLQNLLHEHGIKKGSLADEIEVALARLPPYLANDLDAVRSVGNIAAHPMTSGTTGLIVGVEPGEAEWTIEVLEMLFAELYVRPEESKARRDALNKKLSDAGKPTMKGPK